MSVKVAGIDLPVADDITVLGVGLYSWNHLRIDDRDITPQSDHDHDRDVSAL